MCAKTETRPSDVAGYILNCHNGNATAAIETLIEEIDHLQHQLQIAASAMSRGYTRGWTPQIDRHSE